MKAFFFQNNNVKVDTSNQMKNSILQRKTFMTNHINNKRFSYSYSSHNILDIRLDRLELPENLINFEITDLVKLKLVLLLFLLY